MLRRRPTPVISRRRATLFGLILGLGAAVLVVPLVPSSEAVHLGDHAPRTLEAAHDAQYESEPLTEAVRDEAARKVEAVYFPPDPAVRDGQVQKLDALLTAVDGIRARSSSAQQRLSELAAVPGSGGFSASTQLALISLDDRSYTQLETDARKALVEVLNRPVQPNSASQKVDDYLAANKPAASGDQGDPAAADAEQSALRDLLRALVIQNVTVDSERTEGARQAARDHESPVIVSYSRGQVIAGEGKELDASDVEALRETGVLDSGFDIFKVAGGLAFAALLGVLLGVYASQLQPFSDPGGRQLALTTVVILCAMVAARFALPAVMPDTDQHHLAFAIPLAAAAMVTASLGGLPFAAVVAATVGGFAAFSAAASPDLAGSNFIGSMEALALVIAHASAGLAGAALVARAERFSRYALSAVAVALASAAVMAAFWLIAEPRDNESLAWIALAAGINGVGSAVIAVGAFVLLSMAFGITTRLQLMELAQGHPLLRRLQDEAPGTYHHSMMVGALAERAAEGIGADALVTRVGAYYHDVGKLLRPRFYIENMLDDAESPHDALPPEESAAIIRQHVESGIALARQQRLPKVVRDFIPEHHGTRLVTYFYRRAARGGDGIDPARFRYPGPPPQTRETAIVMLADSCEAVVRANQGTDRGNIDELVDGILAERLAEGQLDQCDITMRELQSVAASFKATLKAVYHPRIVYPDPAPEELARMAGSG